MPQPHPPKPVNIFQPLPSLLPHPQTLSSRDKQIRSVSKPIPSKSQLHIHARYRTQSWMTGITSRKLEARPAGAEQHERRSSEANPPSTPPKEAEPSSVLRRSSALETLYVSSPLASPLAISPRARLPANLSAPHRPPNPASKANISQRSIVATTSSSPTLSARRSATSSPNSDRRWSRR
jgi:hypothetical protein